MVGFLAMLLLIFYFLLHLDYVRRGKSESLTETSPRTAVVLTGNRKRVAVALKLLEEGYFDRVVVTGFELDLGPFSDYMKLPENLRNALESGRLVLLNQALWTFENAIEIRCWLMRNPSVRDFVLITSESHMPRASLAFQRAMPPGYRFTRLISDRDLGAAPGKRESEWKKFLGTWLITLLPQTFWRKGDIKVCQ